ncbi:MAG: hypothetical protein ABJ327_12470 [Litoreibacter sp.]
MTENQARRGGAPVGFITDLDGVEAAAVIYLRLWCNGADAQAQVWSDFAVALGAMQGRKALQSFEQLFSLCSNYGRRPMMRHSVNCKCLGSDESCFANFIAAAADDDHEDAMLIATLLVRPDYAAIITPLAADFGIALKQMRLRAPVELMHGMADPRAKPQTLH